MNVSRMTELMSNIVARDLAADEFSNESVSEMYREMTFITLELEKELESLSQLVHLPTRRRYWKMLKLLQSSRNDSGGVVSYPLIEHLVVGSQLSSSEDEDEISSLYEMIYFSYVVHSLIKLGETNDNVHKLLVQPSPPPPPSVRRREPRPTSKRCTFSLCFEQDDGHFIGKVVLEPNCHFEPMLMNQLVKFCSSEEKRKFSANVVKVRVSQ